MIKEAIVLAGGFGTRLREVINEIPKPMAPVNGEPFLSFVFRYLKKYGIEHIILSVGYKHEVIMDYYGNLFGDIKLTYAIENEPLGTGGAIKFAMEKMETDSVFVLNGDTLFDINLHHLAEKHFRSKADLSMALRQLPDVGRYGTVQIDENQRIISFLEKGEVTGQGNINGGIYLIPAGFFKNLSIFTDRFSMEKDIFEDYYKKYQFHGFEFENYFIDIGIPEDYKRAQIEL